MSYNDGQHGHIHRVANVSVKARHNQRLSRRDRRRRPASLDCKAGKTLEYNRHAHCSNAAAGKPLTRKPYQLNSCHVYKDDSPAVLERWPRFYTGRR